MALTAALLACARAGEALAQTAAPPPAHREARPSGGRTESLDAQREAQPSGDETGLPALRTEVTRLRGIVDELSVLAVSPTGPAPEPPAPEPSWLAIESLAAIGGALAIGFLLGTAVQRQRARRARALRF